VKIFDTIFKKKLSLYVTSKNTPSTKNKNLITRLPAILGVLAAAVFVFGIYMSISVYLNNKHIVESAEKAIATANAGQPSPAAATIKPSSSAVANYSVPALDPKYLIIPSINVDARIYPVGLTKDGAIGVPSNVYDTDWYNRSSRPGDPGSMLIDGHISSWTTKGVFYNLEKLVPGDNIQVIRGDNVVFNYKVIRTIIYSASNIDMNAVLSPVVSSAPGLNLISCSGEVIPGTNEFNQRIVVFTEQVVVPSSSKV